MIGIKVDGVICPVTFQFDANDRHTLVMTDPRTRLVRASISWHAYTGQIKIISVQNKWDRRRGIATALLMLARKRNPNICHSPNRSDDGEAWAQSLGEQLPKRVNQRLWQMVSDCANRNGELRQIKWH